jgi:hypothetical protein
MCVLSSSISYLAGGEIAIEELFCLGERLGVVGVLEKVMLL